MSRFSIVLLIFSIVSYNYVLVNGEFNVRTEIEKYGKCNGKPVYLSAYLVPALNAVLAGNCVKYKEYACNAVCMLFNYPQFMTEEGKANQPWLTKEYETFLAANPSIKDEAAKIFAAAKQCDEWPKGGRTYRRPTDADDKCETGNKMKVCLEAAHKIICGGGSTSDFLDSEPL